MATNTLPGYSYDRNSQRYRNAETGKFVARDRIIELLDSQIQGAEQRMNAMADEYAAGKSTPAAYTDHVRTEVRRLHLQNAALAKGGWDKLDQSDYGRVGAATRQVYAKISGTAADLESGEASIAQAKQRNTAYAGSARRLYHRMEREGVTPTDTGKVVVEQRILDPQAQHCDDCLNYAEMGVEIMGTLPGPGENCQCGDYCRCRIKRWQIDASDIGITVGTQKESAQTASTIYATPPTEFIEDDAGNQMSEIQIEHDAIQLIERAVRDDGTMPIKLIAPGWGTSGFYSPEVLRRDGPRIFVSGTQMFWDHPTMMEEGERPEGSLRNLAAVLVEDARYTDEGPDGPGLYAEAKAFGDYKDAIDELSPHIGVSIRASGRATTGEMDGRKGKIIEEITDRKSADFVTTAGAGGKIIELFEAARDGRTIEEIVDESGTEDTEMSEKLEKQLNEALDAIKQLQDDNQQLRESNARTSEALLLRTARDFVTGALRQYDLPDMTKSRLVESLSANPCVKDGALDTSAYDAKIKTAVDAETDYLKSVAGYGSGQIRGMGSFSESNRSQDDGDDGDKHSERLREAFADMGFGGKELDHAVNGRRVR